MGNIDNISGMSNAERRERARLSQERVLRFLADEGFSTAPLLAKLLGFRQTRSAYKILDRLEERGFIRRKKLPKIEILFALTPSGYAQVESDADKNFRSVSLSRVNPLTLAHRFAIQKCHIAMIHNGVDWYTSTGPLRKNQQKPDGVFWYQFGEEELCLQAVEVELTIKTRKRYQEIISSYNGQNKYQHVIYVMPNESLRKRLTRIFEELHAGNRFAVMTLDRFVTRFTRDDLDTRTGRIQARRIRDEQKAREAEMTRQREAQERQARDERERQEREEAARRYQAEQAERQRQREDELRDERHVRILKRVLWVICPLAVAMGLLVLWLRLFA